MRGLARDALPETRRFIASSNRPRRGSPAVMATVIASRRAIEVGAKALDSLGLSVWWTARLSVRGVNGPRKDAWQSQGKGASGWSSSLPATIPASRRL